MQQLKRPVEQTDPPRSARETLPTMYDLPSEDPEEPGLPDEYHYLQPHLLSATLQLTTYAADEVFSVGDMNLYYDVDHPLWHKRPDWFAVVGVPRLYEGRDMRLSYVVSSPISASRFLSGILAWGFGRGVMRVLSGCGCGGLMPKDG